MKSDLEAFANDEKPRTVDIVVRTFSRPKVDDLVKLRVLKERSERPTLVPTGDEEDNLPF